MIKTPVEATNRGVLQNYLFCNCQEAKLFCETDKILPGSLEKKKEGKHFRIFLEKHILILPGSLELGKKKKRSNICEIFFAEQFLICHGSRLCKHFFWKENTLFSICWLISPLLIHIR